MRRGDSGRAAEAVGRTGRIPARATRRRENVTKPDRCDESCSDWYACRQRTTAGRVGATRGSFGQDESPAIDRPIGRRKTCPLDGVVKPAYIVRF